MQKAILGGLFFALLAGCGSPPEPEEGFHLKARFVSLDPSVIDELRLTFIPQTAVGERFTVPTEQPADDNITLRVETDGSLVMSISGAYAAENVIDEDSPTGIRPVLDLEMWSDDEMSRAVELRAEAYRAGEQIAVNGSTGRVLEWPLPPGFQRYVDVTCRGALSDRCVP